MERLLGIELGAPAFRAAGETAADAVDDDAISFYYCFTIIFYRITKEYRSMKRRILCWAMCAALTGCGGIPLRSLPRLVQLSSTLLEADPAELRVALQIDERIAPPGNAVPKLVIQLKPRVAGAFEPVDRKLPLRLSTEDTAGLDPVPAGRRWLVYSMPPGTQAELIRIQEAIRRAQALPGDKKGGSLSLGIEQTDLAITNPALADTRWSTWLQVRQAQGFFEVWNGTPSQLLALAQKKTR